MKVCKKETKNFISFIFGLHISSNNYYLFLYHKVGSIDGGVHSNIFSWYYLLLKIK